MGLGVAIFGIGISATKMEGLATPIDDISQYIASIVKRIYIAMLYMGQSY